MTTDSRFVLSLRNITLQRDIEVDELERKLFGHTFDDSSDWSEEDVPVDEFLQTLNS